MPALFALLGEIIGIFSSFSIFYKDFIVLSVLLLVILLLLVIGGKRYFIYIILFFALAIFTTNLSLKPFTNPEIPENLFGTELQITGRVSDFSKDTSFPKSFIISNLSIDGKEFSGNARVYAEDIPSPYSTVLLKGTIYRNNLQSGLQKFTGYNYTVFGRKVFVEKSYAIFDFFSRLRTRIEERALLSMKSEDAFLFLSSVPGISSLNSEEKLPFRNTGTAHIFAISGLHFGILGETSYSFFNLFTPLASEFSFAILALFLFLVGFKVSAIRAFLMYGAGMLAKITGRELVPINTLCFVALVILLISPIALFSVSFQLSFLAILALLIIAPLFYQYLPQNFVFRMLSEVFSVQLLLLPVFAYYFHSISVVSILSNFVVIPFMYLLIPIGVIQLILIVLSFKLAVIFSPVTNLFFSVLFSIVKFFSRIPFAALNIQFSGYLVMIYFIILSILIFSYSKRKKWRNLVFIPIILVVVTPFFIKPAFCITPLKLTGEDGFIIQSGNKVIYISSPTSLKSEDKDLYAIQLALEKKGINKIDLMIFDAPFKQKESSSTQLIKQGIVKNIVLPDFDSELQKMFITLNKEKVHIDTIPGNGKIHFGDMTFDFVTGENNSYSTLVEHKNRTFLLTGNQFQFGKLSYHADVVYIPKSLLEKKGFNQLRFGEIYTY